MQPPCRTTDRSDGRHQGVRDGAVEAARAGCRAHAAPATQMPQITLRLVAQWVLESGFRRVEAEADVANIASRRAIEKAGFVREGILRDHCETHGRRHDCVMFALVRADLDGGPT